MLAVQIITNAIALPETLTASIPSMKRLVNGTPSPLVPSCTTSFRAGPRSARMGSVTAADARNVTPLTANAAAGEPSSNKMPPTAGPTA